MAGRSLPSPKRYARVLLELAQARGEVESWRGILQDMAEAAANPDFAALLEAPGLSAEEKLAAAREVLPDATELGYNLLVLLARRRAVNLLSRIQEEFEAGADVLEGVQRVEVRTAVLLDQGQQRRITEGLQASLGLEVRLTARVDPALLGGMVVRIGDRVIDGSTRGRLQALRHSLAAGAIEAPG